MSLPVLTTPEVDAQIAAIDRWWRSHRSASPSLFCDELAAAIEFIGGTPELGRPYRLSPVPGTRRFLLRRARFHVYYIATEVAVTVLAVWHARRGEGPPLRAESRRP